MRDLTIACACPFCKGIQFIEVESEDWLAYSRQEGLIQDLMPYLTPEERESIISGICPKCWDEMFGVSEEDEDPEEDYDYDLECGFDPYEGCYTFDC